MNKLLKITAVVAIFLVLTTFALTSGVLIARYGAIREAVADPQGAPVRQVGPVNTLTNGVDSVVTVAATPTCTKVVTKSSAIRAVSIQNASTVVVCCSKKSTCDCAATPANISGILKAGAVAFDGTGGTYSLGQYGGDVYCASASGSVSVVVGTF